MCEIKPPKVEARRRVSETATVSFLPMEGLGIGEKYAIPTQTKTLQEAVGSYTYFADGDVLLAKITPCFENGKLGIASNLSNGIGFGSSEYIVFRPHKSLDKEWLYYFLSRADFRREGAQNMTGAVGHKRVAKEFVDAYPIPLPPLPEQQRIVRILDQAFDALAAAKANAEQNRLNARALFDSYLERVFAQRGEEWVETRLEEVCGFQNGFAFKGNLFKEAGRSILRISNIQNECVETKGLVFFDQEDYHEDLDKYRIFKNDLLIAMSGGTTGKIGFNTTEQVFYMNQRVGKFEPRCKLNKKYLYYFLSTKVEENLRISAGSAQPNLSTEQIKGFALPLPPFAEQQHIVAQLDALREQTQQLESLYRQKEAALNELKRALLHQAFAGEL